MRLVSKLGLAAYFVVCSGCAIAAVWSNAAPPQRFQMPSMAVVKVVPEASVQAECGLQPPASISIKACSRRLSGTGVIVLPDPCPFAEAGEQFAHLACHEFAHISGWSGEHPK